MAVKPSVHAGHRKRVRERFFKGGLDVFSAHEVVELLLFCAIPQRDVNELAHALVEKFGSVDGVLNATEEELMTVRGIGAHTAKVLRTFDEVCRYYETERFRPERKVRNIKEAIFQAHSELEKNEKYRMTVLFESVGGNLLTARNFLWSERNEKCTYKVLSIAMELNAHQVIVLLKSNTSQLPPGEVQEILDMLTVLYNAEINTVDCVVMSQGRMYSMRKEQMLRISPTERIHSIRDDSGWLEPLIGLNDENGWYRLNDLHLPGEAGELEWEDPETWMLTEKEEDEPALSVETMGDGRADEK